MHRPRSKRTQIIRATIVYTVMTVLILIGLTIGVLYTMGYRLNTADHTIEQGGLLQIASLPSGATVTLDQRQLSGTSPQRVDARAGSHTIQMTRDGYRPWQKTVTVEPGTVHWANYARLLPIEPAERTEREFTQLAATLPGVERDVMLALEDPLVPTFQLLDISGDTATASTVTLPNAIVATLPEESNGTYHMTQWDAPERRVLVEYRAGVERQWLVIDTRSADSSLNVSSLLEGAEPVRSIMFDARDNRSIYVLTGNVLRRLNTDTRALSAPIADRVDTIWQSIDGVVTYTAVRDDEGRRAIGYVTPGAATGRIVDQIEAGPRERVMLIVGDYLNRRYAAIQHGSDIDIRGIDLGSSDSDAPVRSERVATMQLPEPPRELTFSPNDRFVYMQYGATFATYDLELGKPSTTTVQGDEPVRQPMGWLDNFHVYSDRGDRLRWYEFDGENAQNITAIASGFAPKITNNNRFLYVIQPGDTNGSYRLVRVSLRI